MKKIFSLVLALLIGTLLMSIAVSADEIACGVLEPRAIQDGYIAAPANQTTPDVFYGVKSTDANKLDEYAEKIFKAWDECSSEAIDIYELGFNVSDTNPLNDYYCGLVNENPQYFYVKSGLSYSYYKDTGRIVKITPQYNFTADQIPELKEKFEAKKAEALSVINESMSDIDKMIALHDYIVLNAEYDLDTYNTLNNEHPTSFTAYGVLVNNVGVCQSYTLAYVLLLKEAGIEVGTVQSRALNHIWNIVKIDGNWYHVDVTWDDPTPNMEGYIDYSHFLSSDNEFKTTGNHNSNDWVTKYSATSETYRNAFWKASASPLAYFEGYYYYADNNGKSTATANILKSELSNVESSELVRALKDLFWKYTGGNAAGGRFQIVPFTFDGNLYYNTTDSIYRLCPEYNSDELVSKVAVTYGYITPIKIDEEDRTVSCLNTTYNATNGTYVSGSSYYVDLDDGHNYTETVIPPKDTEYGYTKHDCSTCGDSRVSDYTEPLKYLPGDPDGDGEVTAVDAIVMARVMANWSGIIDTALDINLDLDSDEKLTSIDLIILNRHLAGWVGYETIPFNK